MKFGIIAQGSNGDVEMLTALALGLVNNGYRVEMFIITFNNRDYSFLNKKEGLTIFQKHIYEAYRSEVNNFEFWNDQFEYAGFYYTLHQSFRSDLENYSLQFAQRCDVMISLYHIYEVSYIAELFKIPFITVNFPMAHIRSAYESPFSLANMEELDREKRWDMFESDRSIHFRRKLNSLRRKLSLSNPDLPCLDRIENGLQIVTSRVLNLIPYSSVFARQKPDINSRYQFCGYLKSSYEVDNWNVPADLQSFMEDELPPVFMTVGSMIENENDMDKLHHVLLDASYKVNRRVIILSRWKESDAAEDNVYKLNGFVDYRKILSKCSFVVHHGGIGIMHHTLESGCPAIIIKYGHDQFYNAKLLFDMGLSNGSIDRKELNPDVLAELINKGLENNVMKQSAMECGEQIKDENGVLRAVELIEAALVNKI